MVDAQGLPLGLIEEDHRGIEDLSSQLHQMEEPPHHHHVDRQTGFETMIVAHLAVFDAAPGLEHPMKDLDAPSFRIPADHLRRRLKGSLPAWSSEASIRAVRILRNSHSR